MNHGCNLFNSGKTGRVQYLPVYLERTQFAKRRGRLCQCEYNVKDSSAWHLCSFSIIREMKTYFYWINTVSVLEKDLFFQIGAIIIIIIGAINFTQGRTATETNRVTWLASTQSLAASFQVKTSLHKQIYLCSVYLGLYPRRQEQLNRYVWKLLLLCIRGFSNCKRMPPTAQCRAAVVRGSKSERRFREGHFQSQVTPSIHRGTAFYR